MKKVSAFNEVRPRTAKDEARQREIKAARAMEELYRITDEDEYRRVLANLYGIVPGHPRYEKALSTWRSVRREMP